MPGTSKQGSMITVTGIGQNNGLHLQPQRRLVSDTPLDVLPRAFSCSSHATITHHLAILGTSVWSSIGLPEFSLSAICPSPGL